MTSKSSTTYDEDDDDLGNFIPWLELLFKVDTISTDILLSNEELLTERFIFFYFFYFFFSFILFLFINDFILQFISYLKGGTLPAILRRLTLIETTSQSQIWAFLLHSRLFVNSKYLLIFLIKRFFLSPNEVDQYASTVRNEVYNPDSLEKIIEEEQDQEYDFDHNNSTNSNNNKINFNFIQKGEIQQKFNEQDIWTSTGQDLSNILEQV